MTRFARMVGLVAIPWAVACGGDGGGTAPEVLGVLVTPDNTLLVGVGDTTTLEGRALGAGGGTVPGARIDWRSLTPGVLAVDATGLVTAVGAGVGSVLASSDGAEATATVEVWVPPEVARHEPGRSYYGREGYVEYIPGRLPVVVSAPHGGLLEPAEIPDRTYGTTVTDTNTRWTIMAARDAFLDRTGMAPHVIVSHLRRTKLDPNREIVEAAQGNAFAENAWEEFQRSIETASDRIEEDFGSGLYFDLHGHGHDVPRVEIGILISGDDLEISDEALASFAVLSSLSALSRRVEIGFAELVRGPTSLGALLADRGIRSVPSPADPHPGGNPYFSGGYDTARHGSRDGGAIDGMQLELHYPGVRDSDPNRRAFGAALAESVELYMLEHYGFFAPASTAARRSRHGPAAVASAGTGPLD